jgi:hypothetical protein
VRILVTFPCITFEKPDHRFGPIITQQIDFAFFQTQVASVLDGHYREFGITVMSIVGRRRPTYVAVSQDAFAITVGIGTIFPFLSHKADTGKCSAEVPFRCEQSLCNDFAGLDWLTVLRGDIEANGFFGALANQQH